MVKKFSIAQIKKQWITFENGSKVRFAKVKDKLRGARKMPRHQLLEELRGEGKCQ